MTLEHFSQPMHFQMPKMPFGDPAWMQYDQPIDKMLQWASGGVIFVLALLALKAAFGKPKTPRK